MAKQVQHRRGTTAQHTTFTGAVGEVTVDTDRDAVVVHDGTTPGGFPHVVGAVVANIAALRNQTVAAGYNTRVKGYYTDGDGGGGYFYPVTTGGPYTDNGGTIITPGGASSSSAWLRFVDDPYNIRWFGAKCDGTTNDTAAFTAAIALIGSNPATLVIPGPSKIASNLTFGAGTTLSFTQSGRLVGTAGTEVITPQLQVVASRRLIFNSVVVTFAKGVTVYPEWFGAVRDGATDDRAAIVAALASLVNGGEVDFEVGAYAISNNINITKNDTFLNGAGQYRTDIIHIGATNATAFQFVGGRTTSSLTNASVTNGSATVTAVSTTGFVLGMTAYFNGNPNGTITNIVGTTVTISTPYLGVTSASVDFVGSSVTPLAGCQISGMHIYRNSAATGGVGVLFQDTAVAKISDVQVTNFGIGIYLRGATNTQLSRVLSANVDGSFSFVGFQLDGTFPVTGSGFGMSAGNFSSVFYDCWVEGRGNTSTDSKGFYILGKVIQDYQFYGANTQGTDYGIVIDGTNVTGTYYPWGDIIFVGAIIDGYSLAGAQLVNILETRAVNFVGGWFNCSALPAIDVFDFSLTNCRNVTISDIQMQSGSNWGTAYSVYADTCQLIKVLNCTITDKYYGLVFLNSEYSLVANTSFYKDSSIVVNALRHITLDNSVRCGLTSNMHDGGCDIAVEVKSNCTAIPITACMFNPGSITTRISDPGSKASLSNNVGT